MLNIYNINTIIKKHIYAFTGLFIIFMYLLINALNIQNNTFFIEKLMISSILFVIYFFKKKYDKDSLTNDDFITCIIIIGFIMRIGYMLYTPCNVREHDVGNLNLDSYGHASYILNIIQNHKLPNSNVGQFYQQPLFYLLSSLVSNIINTILGRNDSFFLVDAAKTFSCFASCSILILSLRIFEELDMKGTGKKIAMVLIAFLPNFYLMGGRVNSDALATFFMTATILYTLKWNKNISWKNTLILAVIFGCAVMTKISCGIIAVFTASIMIHKLYKMCKEHNAKEILIKLLSFACISFPLGLWYSVRNYILFNQSFMYVPKPSMNSGLYCGDHSLFERFILISFKNLFSSPYADPFNDYNYPSYLIKGAAFGEFKFNNQGFIPIMLLFFTMIIAAILMLSIIYVYIRSNAKIIIKYGLLLLFLLIYLSSIRFNISYPFGCTIDFRYIAVSYIIGTVFIGLTYEEIKTNISLHKENSTSLKSWFLSLVNITIAMFSIFSLIFYLSI